MLKILENGRNPLFTMGTPARFEFQQQRHRETDEGYATARASRTLWTRAYSEYDTVMIDLS